MHRVVGTGTELDEGSQQANKGHRGWSTDTAAAGIALSTKAVHMKRDGCQTKISNFSHNMFGVYTWSFVFVLPTSSSSFSYVFMCLCST